MMRPTTKDRETAMNARHLSSMLASLGWGLCLLAMPPASAAADSFMAVTSAEKPAKPQKPKAAKPPKPAPSGSGESKAERDKRLLRECRGKANAGACEGYAN
jgi:cell division septation protein DedD